jgi:conjugal transfer pilus assembly protein TraK
MRIVSLVMLLSCAMTPALVPAQEPPVRSIGGVSLPGVPPEVTVSADKPRVTRDRPSVSSVASGADSTESNVAITVTPGAAEIIRIASGFLNRIITPFDSPKLLSVNPLEVQKEGSSLFVAASSDRPVGVHILSNDPDDPRSISLTLVPAQIPPRTVELKWPQGKGFAAAPAGHGKSKHWEEAAPYEETLLELVRVIARGEIPEGYSLDEHPGSLPCALPGLRYETGQRLNGTHFSVFVLRATNVGQSPLEIYSHGGCNLPGVVLVAPWPSAFLEPKSATELYVAVSNDTFDPRSFERVRPSLLTR